LFSRIYEIIFYKIFIFKNRFYKKEGQLKWQRK
jgi:hypothetical protein